MPIEQIDTATATPTYLHEDHRDKVHLRGVLMEIVGGVGDIGAAVSDAVEAEDEGNALLNFLKQGGQVSAKRLTKAIDGVHEAIDGLFQLVCSQ